MIDAFRKARLAIDDEMVDLHAATGILHLAYRDMEGDGRGGSALAQSIHSAARTIEALLERIEAKLAPDEPAATPCSCYLGEEVAS